MGEYIEEAGEELKRADHLVFVTLKYTRTADVIKNAIHRLINAFNLIILEALEHAKKKRRIKEIPSTPVVRRETLKKVIKSKEIDAFMRLYDLLKKIDKAEYTKKCEYRKHVALIAAIDGKKIEINIERLRDFFDRTNVFLSFICEWMWGKKDE